MSVMDLEDELQMQESERAEATVAPDRSNIQICLRVRPVPEALEGIHADEDEKNVRFTVPRNFSQGLTNNQRKAYQFTFNKLFAADSTQEEVFNAVASDVVPESLEGINGTVFAYGQTGSGKTFTITGGSERYEDRGIIPRAISLIFSTISKRTHTTYTVHVSYLEIFNEAGYDLLDEEREVRSLEELPRVHVMEDEDGNIHTRNLSLHRANTEEDALNLLFLGDTNRTISETPMNMASSRSHCIFTLHLEARKVGGDAVRTSRLNLVDLAGSERVAKTQINGAILREAKYINLSLHYLEQVIIALQERSMGRARFHIPYRNSMMTLVLRDSLGGNCRTIMIANISGASSQIEESISTCRFAERVAMISNTVAVNEEIDPHIVIQRLRQEICDLKDEIRILRNGHDVEEESSRNMMFTEEEKINLSLLIDVFIADESPSATLNLGDDIRVIRAVLPYMKAKICQSRATLGNGDTVVDEEGLANTKAMHDLKVQVHQRDKEIRTLIGILRNFEDAMVQNIEGDSMKMLGKTCTRPSCIMPNYNAVYDNDKRSSLFKEFHPSTKNICENQELVEGLLVEAKALGDKVHRGRQAIAKAKEALKQQRSKRSFRHNHEMSTHADDHGSYVHEKDEEGALLEIIELEKRNCRKALERLKQLKPQVEHIHLLISNSHKTIKEDLYTWGAVMIKNRQINVESCSSEELPSTQHVLYHKISLRTEGTNKDVEEKQDQVACVVDIDDAHENENIATGNALADANIKRFYAARAALLRPAISLESELRMEH